MKQLVRTFEAWAQRRAVTAEPRYRHSDLRLIPAVAAVWCSAFMGTVLDRRWCWGIAVTLSVLVIAALVCASLPAPPRHVLAQGVFLAGLSALTLALAAASGMQLSPELKQEVRDKASVRVVVVLAQPIPPPTSPDETAAASHLPVPVAGTLRFSFQPTHPPAASWEAAHAPVTLSLSPQLLAAMPASGASVGDQLEFIGKLGPPSPGKRTALAITPQTTPTVSSRGTATSWLEAAKSAFHGSAARVWGSGDVSGLLEGMVDGSREGISNSLSANMKAASLTHLTAVSGSNCMIVVAGVTLLLRRLKCPRILASLLSALALALFVALVGPDPSVLRAALMAYLSILTLVAGRASRAGSVLAWCVIGLLLVDQWLSADLGFMLSVAATAGLLLLGRPLAHALGRFLPYSLALLISVPLAAQLFCSPLLVYLQGALTPYSVAANVAVAPLVPLVTIAGMLAIMTAWAVPAVADACCAVAGAAVRAVIWVADVCAGLPSATIPMPAGAVGIVLAAALSILGAAALLLAARWAWLRERLLVRALQIPGWQNVRVLGGTALSACGLCVVFALAYAGGYLLIERLSG